MGRDYISDAIDHFGDAVRFLKEARTEVDKGRETEAMRFIGLASDAASSGESAMRNASPNY